MEKLTFVYDTSVHAHILNFLKVIWSSRVKFLDFLFIQQEMTEEQKEGAFSNFPISKVTVELLQGKFLGMMWSQEVNYLSCFCT